MAQMNYVTSQLVIDFLNTDCQDIVLCEGFLLKDFVCYIIKIIVDKCDGVLRPQRFHAGKNLKWVGQKIFLDPDGEEVLNKKVKSNAELREVLVSQQIISGREDSSKTDDIFVVDKLDTVHERDDSSQKTEKMSNLVPRRDDSSKTGNLKKDEDSDESDNSNDVLACELLEGAKLVDIMKKTIELEKRTF